MKRILTVITGLLAAVSLFAQASIKVQAPNLVALDEQFTVAFVISGEESPTDFQWSPGDDFKLVWGPQKGTSTSISIINGNRTKSSQTTYTYVLMPKTTGRFTLQPATASIKGDRVTSSSHSVEVVSNGAQASQGQSQGQSQSGSQAQQGQSQPSSDPSRTGTVDSGDLFLRLSLSKTSAVVGETISATLKLYQRVNIAGFDDAKFPSFDGFWSQEVQAPTNIEFHRENVGDVIYNAALLRSWTLIPQQAGDITIDPAELVCLVNVRAPRSSSGSIFDSFFQDEYQTVRKRITTGTYKVHVNPVPAGAPASFSGGVGNFKMSAELTRDSLKTHDAASLKVSVSGTGNLALISAPKLDFPPDFEVYDVKTTESSGTRVFEYPFIPRSSGDFVIGPVEFSYYDVSARKYVTLTSAEMPISVARGKDDGTSSTGGQLVSGTVRKDVRDLGTDIRFIRSELPNLRDAGWFFVASPLFVTLAALLLLAAVAVWLLTRRYFALRADVAGTKNKAATKMARKRLSFAKDYLDKDLHSAYYEELHKALLGFVSDKFNMDAADLSRDNIREKLLESGASESASDRFVELLDACEFARYAPDSGHEAMNEHYESAVSVISDIDDSMRRKHKAPAAAALAALLMVLPGVTSQAQDTAALWAEGTAAYTEGRWQDAVDSWEAIAATGNVSADLYYNIGNAFFKNSDMAHAILNYRRALKIDPSDADARYNLEFARSMVQDKIESVPEFFLKTSMRKFCWLLPSDAWAVLCLVLFAAALSMALLFLLSSRPGIRKTGFFVGIISLIFSILCLCFSLSQRKQCLSDTDAVVVSSVVPVKSAPGSGSGTDLFVLHEGTEVVVIGEVGEWQNIELADGRQGWVQGRNIEKVKLRD